jgi:hypothetical protein
LQEEYRNLLIQKEEVERKLEEAARNLLIQKEEVDRKLEEADRNLLIQKEEADRIILQLKFLPTLVRESFEPNAMLDYFTRAQMTVQSAKLINFADYRHSPQLSQDYLINPSSAHSIRTAYRNISNLRRSHVKEDFFNLSNWLTDRVSCEEILKSKFRSPDQYTEFMTKEVEILTKIRSALVFLLEAGSIDELTHVERMYIIYKIGFLGRLKLVCCDFPQVSVSPANSFTLSMEASFLTEDQSYKNEPIRGNADVCTGSFIGTVQQADLNQIRTIEELKVPGGQLRCAAYAAKDQSLFEVACLGNMRMVGGSDTFFFGCQ